MRALLLELFSVLSRLINVITGGTADVTFSAQSHIDGLWSERLIDAVARLLFGEVDHCRKWWGHEVERSRRVIMMDFEKGRSDAET